MTCFSKKTYVVCNLLETSGDSKLKPHKLCYNEEMRKNVVFWLKKGDWVANTLKLNSGNEPADPFTVMIYDR